jgi:hypothetical protein
MALEKLKSSSSRPSGEVGKVGEEIIQNGYEEGSWKEKEKKLARKIDRNIIPLTMLLYMFSFLDRGELVDLISEDEMTGKGANWCDSQYWECEVVWSAAGSGVGGESVSDCCFDFVCYLLCKFLPILRRGR